MTRYATFIKRRRKYLRRRHYMHQRGWQQELRPGIAPPHTMHWFNVERVTPLWGGNLQRGPDVRDHEGGDWLLTALFFPPATFTLSEIGPGKPPHVTLTGFWRARADLRAPRWERFGVVGYHNRRVHYVGHKPDRMNGRERKIFGAGYFCYTTGYFPEWDPLQRHPNEQDVLNGSPLYDGPFPQTPRGE